MDFSKVAFQHSPRWAGDDPRDGTDLAQDAGVRQGSAAFAVRTRQTGSGDASESGPGKQARRANPPSHMQGKPVA